MAIEMEKLVALCKRRGFIFQSSEIYGGISGFWDYGPLGVELKKNIKDAWWHDMVRNPPPGPDGKEIQMVGVDCAIIMNPKVWEASGHVGGFADPMVDCKKCKSRFRADQVAEATCPLKPSKRPGECGGELTEPRQFNLMFETYVGAVRDEENKTYLRPETAQGMFYNFRNVLDTTRVKVPFGLAQLGKGFRNEITPRNFIFRSREFEQMEMEYFIHEDADWDKCHKAWIEWCRQWLISVGLPESHLSLYAHPKEKLAFYSKGTVDIMFKYPFGVQELWGIAARGNYDLNQHATASGKPMDYFDEASKKKFVPHVIEPAVGVDRIFLAVLCAGYAEEEVKDEKGGVEKRTVLRLNPRIAPVKVAVLPLLKKREDIVRTAHAIRDELSRQWRVVYDDTAAIGRLYRRQDEVGTPYCVTVDVQTVGDTDKGESADGKVTIRDRDSMEQIRVPVGRLGAVFGELLGGARWADVAAGAASG